MKGRKWRDRLACGFLVAGTIVGVALAAGTQGSKADPLVTLSYLNDVAKPEILQQVDQKLVQREDELAEKLRQEGSADQGSFKTVELAAGTTVTLTGGAQVLLRSGTASSFAHLVDVTTGETLSGNLTANHLYLATAYGQTFTMNQAGTVLILGQYR